MHQHVAATHQQRQIASCVLEDFCENLCCCKRILSPQQVVQIQSDLIFATCCSDKILLRRQRFSQNFCTHEAICRCDVSPHRVAVTSSPTCSHGVICRRDVLLQLVAKCVATFKKTVFYSFPLFTEACIWVSKESKSPFCGMAFIKLLTIIHKS